MDMKTFRVLLNDGSTEDVKAHQVAYDGAGNLCFLVLTKGIVTQQNPNGEQLEAFLTVRDWRSFRNITLSEKMNKALEVAA